jgi:poly(A)-specific ribonuclease
MRVSSANFPKILPLFEECLKTAEFYSIDLEFSGLGDRLDYFDTMLERYLSIRKSVSQHLPLQVGITLFHHSPTSRCYIAHPFTFDVFPATSRQLGLEKSFTSQSSSLVFLSENGFNFNDWVKNGIPYMNFDDESHVRNRFKMNNSPLASLDESNHVFLVESLYFYFNQAQLLINGSKSL